jgi:hypothetical protein
MVCLLLVQVAEPGFWFGGQGFFFFFFINEKKKKKKKKRGEKRAFIIQGPNQFNWF